MITYRYTALDRNGGKVSGQIEAFNEMDAVDRIKASCDIVLKLSEVKTSGAAALLNLDIGGNKLNQKAFIVMCSQFAIILRAGIPIARTVSLIAEKTPDKTLKKVLTQVADDVHGGRSLAGSLEERGNRLFPMTFIETIRAGEESGNVDRAFQTMYKQYDKQMKMRGRVKAALTYPAFVIAVAVCVVIVLMVKVVPTFIEIFDSYGASLPAITQLLINISLFFKKYWIGMLLTIAFVTLLYKLYDATEKGRLNIGKTVLKIPVMGNISELNAASQFAGNMATLLAAGLPLTRCISITAKVIDNYYLSQEIGKLSGRLEEGHSLADCMRETACLPDILIDMTAVGEETGELEQTLSTIAGYYDAELEMAINDALGKLEPTVLLFVAGVAGFVVVAIYIAMFEMYGVM